MDPAQLEQMMQNAIQAAVAAALAGPQNAIIQAQIQQQVQQQVQAQVAAQQAAQQAAAAAAAAAAPAVTQAAQVPFMLNPALAGNEAWDLMSSTGLKIHMAAIAPIVPAHAGEESLLNSLLRKMWLRAEAFGFTRILMIDDADGIARNLTKAHGCLTKVIVTAAAMADIRDEDRRTQAQELLRQLIQGSCTTKMIDGLEHRSADCTHDVAMNGAPAPEMAIAGASMLFELVAMASVQTRATVSSLMNCLDDLETIMIEKKSDIKEFNAEIESICDALRARRKQPPEPLTKLFLGCTSCEDQVFRDCIKRKEESYKDGSLSFTDEQLMSLALEKFKILHDDKKMWLKKSQQELEFIAMQSELTRLKQNPHKKKPPKDNPSDSSKARDKKWAWKMVPPAEGEPKTKTFQGKECVHCPHHETMMWVLKINKRGTNHLKNCEEKARAEAKATKEGGAKALALANVMDDPDARGGGDDASEDGENI